MVRRLAVCAVLGFVALVPRASRAAARVDDCRNGSFAGLEFSALSLATVSSPGRTYFLDDVGPRCPSDAVSCRRPSYVVQGDTVLTGHSHGAYVCAFFPNRVGGSAGWLKASDLKRVGADAMPPLQAWAGRWRDGDDSIAITVRKGELVAQGEAFWPSANPSPRDAPGGPHLGDMAGSARPTGATVVYGSADDCRVQLKLLGRYLVASDNGFCGGANVRFDGVYQRK